MSGPHLDKLLIRLASDSKYHPAKTFRYLTPTLFVEPTHLIGTDLLGSKSFHFFADPSEIMEQTTRLLELREAAGIVEQPLIVWEPRAYSCAPGYLRDIINAMQIVDVFSANHLELAQIMATDVPATPDKDFFARLCTPLMLDTSESFAHKILIIRAGDMGCFVKSKTQGVWLPAYHSPSRNGAADGDSKVVDTTGAGNAFLGAFAIGFLQSSGDIISAACAGNVAASFVVEQVGVPALTISEDGKDFWNGEAVSSRLEAYKRRLGISPKAT